MTTTATATETATAATTAATTAREVYRGSKRVTVSTVAAIHTNRYI